MKKYLLILLLLLNSGLLTAQETPRQWIDTLTSATLWGRGYTRDGMTKAASMISTAFANYGLQPLDGKSFQQGLSYPVNTFPGKMEVSINNKKLEPGKDFLILPQSIAKTGKASFIQQDSTTFVDPAQRVIILLKDKLTWSPSPEVADYTALEVDKKVLNGLPQTAILNIDQQFVPDFKAANVCGMVKGTAQPDSLLVISAHYDHLGSIGDSVYFPGANDNASGVALLLSMAKYYATHPQRYTMVFLCFAGEEIGLMGSRHFTEHPLIDLTKVRMLVNVDMVGTGNTGITVVNATVHTKAFELLNKVNDTHQYLVKINARGPAANSDHYFFTQKGVPAFFIYTTGGISAYHDIYDQAKTLPLTAFESLYQLLLGFNAQLQETK